jgi:hypothetical protein
VEVSPISRRDVMHKAGQQRVRDDTIGRLSPLVEDHRADKRFHRVGCSRKKRALPATPSPPIKTCCLVLGNTKNIETYLKNEIIPSVHTAETAIWHMPLWPACPASLGLHGRFSA